MVAKKSTTKPAAVESTEDDTPAASGPPQAKVLKREVTDRYKAFAEYVKEQTGLSDPKFAQHAQITQSLYGKFQKTETNVGIRQSISASKAEQVAARAQAAAERKAAREAKEAEAAKAKANKPAAKAGSKKSPATEAAEESSGTVTPIKAAKKVAAKKPGAKAAF
jgi:hypothetical protein